MYLLHSLKDDALKLKTTEELKNQDWGDNGMSLQLGRHSLHRQKHAGMIFSNVIHLCTCPEMHT